MKQTLSMCVFPIILSPSTSSGCAGHEVRISKGCATTIDLIFISHKLLLMTILAFYAAGAKVFNQGAKSEHRQGSLKKITEDNDFH